MKRIIKIILYVILTTFIIIVCVVAFMWLTHEPNWHVEEKAVKSDTHPYAGFWKDDGCNDDWGLAIGPAGEGRYYISFCGPGGCFAENTYLANTSIADNPKYNIIDENNIEVWTRSGWSTYSRCSGRT